MLTKKKLTDVRELAKQVIELTEAVEHEAEESAANTSWKTEAFPYYGGSALTGTLRRRSMDLSRALIELRKP